LQATTSFVWSAIGETPIVRADPGRQQTHFYGALDLLTGQEIVWRSEVMTGAVTALFLQRLLESTPEDIPVIVFLDRAPWHRGEEVAGVLKANPHLELIFFPTASPDLNPQEHVWKAARKAVSHNHDFAALPALAGEFENFLQNTMFPNSFLDRFGYTAIYPMFI
jgi:transposase